MHAGQRRRHHHHLFLHLLEALSLSLPHSIVLTLSLSLCVCVCVCVKSSEHSAHCDHQSPASDFDYEAPTIHPTGLVSPPASGLILRQARRILDLLLKIRISSKILGQILF